MSDGNCARAGKLEAAMAAKATNQRTANTEALADDELC
jgi:hypothetical protein